MNNTYNWKDHTWPYEGSTIKKHEPMNIDFIEPNKDCDQCDTVNDYCCFECEHEQVKNKNLNSNVEINLTDGSCLPIQKIEQDQMEEFSDDYLYLITEGELIQKKG